MLWHFQNKPFLSRNVDMYVFPPQILGTNENVCHVSFILETPKLHGLGLSFFSPRYFRGFFWPYSIPAKGIASAETTKGRCVTWGMGDFREQDRAHNSTWGRGQCMAEGKSMTSSLLFPSKATEEAAVRKELKQQGMDVCSFTELSFKWLCCWGADFPSTRSLSQSLASRVFSICWQALERQTCRVTRGMLRASFFPSPVGDL